MAVLRNQVSSWQQAYDYMIGSAQSAAAGVCPGATSVYNAFAQKYKDRQDWIGNVGAFTKQEFQTDLLSADVACKASPDYAQKTGVPTAPAGSTSPAPKVDAHTGGAAPIDIGNGVARAGIPWWAWVAGGAALYLLFGKKKKGRK